MKSGQFAGMDVKRFTARTSRDALKLVREAFGSDAVVLSTRPCEDGVEVLAMAPEAVQHFERVAQPADSGFTAPAPAPARAIQVPRAPAAHSETRPAPLEASSPEQDAQRLAMSTLSFQDYVRERMLRRRRAEMAPLSQAPAETATRPPAALTPASALPVFEPPFGAAAYEGVQAAAPQERPRPAPLRTQQAATAAAAYSAVPAATAASAYHAVPAAAHAAAHHAVPPALLDELRAMKGLIEQRFGALAFMDKLQREPRQATLSQKLLDCGFSPALTRKLADGLPADVEEMAWAASVLERNLATGEHEPALEDAGGVFALIGATGVGKTTSTAKLAAAFATRHGAANLGLITLDAYRIAAHEQLRAYGRILGVPVHTAHDRASLDDLLELLAGKRMVLIDTAGMAQRDTRTRELLEMLSHRAVQKLLVVNAAAQGETIEDVLVAYHAAACRGIVLSKLDEAVKVGPALDALIRHKLKVLAVANGQRVPEDWHRLSSATLVQRALRAGGSPAWKLDGAEVKLIFAGAPAATVAASRQGSAAEAA